MEKALAHVRWSRQRHRIFVPSARLAAEQRQVDGVGHARIACVVAVQIIAGDGSRQRFGVSGMRRIASQSIAAANVLPTRMEAFTAWRVAAETGS